MRSAILLFMGLFAVQVVYAADATSAWRKVLRNCAASDLIGKKQVLFFGVSNSVGPGSVWRFADDRSIRLLFELSDAFPKTEDRAKLIVANDTVANCSGNSSTKWDLRLGLPFSTPATSLSANIAAELRKAKSVTVSVDGFAIDNLKETPWKDAFAKLGQDSPYAEELRQPNRVIASNVVRVSGLKAVFTFGTELSADVKASFSGKSFALGAAKSASENQAAAATDTASTQTAPPSESTSQVPANSPSATLTPCSKMSATGGPSATGGKAVASSTHATLHAEVSAANQITVCSQGPFYMLAAYSRLVGGKPIGVNSPTALPLTLKAAKLPKGVVPKSGS